MKAVKSFSKNFIPLLFFCIFSGLIAVSLGQDANFDLRNYHYNNPFAFLNNKTNSNFFTSQIQTYFNPLVNLLPYLLSTVFSGTQTAFILGFIQGLNAFLIFRIVLLVLGNYSQKLKIFLAGAVALISLTGPGNISELGTVFADNFNSIFILLSLYFLIIFIRNDFLPKKKVFFSGFFLAIGLGIKLTAYIYIIPFALAVIFLILFIKNKRDFILILFLGFLLGFLISYAWWGFHVYQTIGNPVFPFYNAVFHSPWLADNNFFDARFYPKTLAQQIFYPFYFIELNTLISEVPFRDLRFAAVYFLVFILFSKFLIKKLFERKKLLQFKENLQKNPDIVIQLFLLIFFICAYINWQLVFSIQRYLIPIELLTGLIALILLKNLFKNKKFLSLIFIFLTGLLIFWSKPMDWGRVEFTEKYIQLFDIDNEKYSDSVIFLASQLPISYIIPEFPANNTFYLYYYQHFFNQDNIYREVNIRLKNSQDIQKFLIYNKTLLKQSLQIEMSKYNLQISNECSEFSTNLKDYLYICKLY